MCNGECWRWDVVGYGFFVAPNASSFFACEVLNDFVFYCVYDSFSRGIFSTTDVSANTDEEGSVL